MKIYHAPNTRSHRVVWLFEELGLPYELELFKLGAPEMRAPEYRKVHPMGRVPALEDDGQVIFESGAIIQYVLARHGGGRLVPAVDADGNDIAGVRAPMVQAPLGTYTGWNLRDRGQGEGYMHEFTGSYVPLPETDSVRRSTADPRRSIVERYGDSGGYTKAVVAAAKQLVADRLMLKEDVEGVEAQSKDWGRPLHDVRL